MLSYRHGAVVDHAEKILDRHVSLPGTIALHQVELPAGDTFERSACGSRSNDRLRYGRDTEFCRRTATNHNEHINNVPNRDCLTAEIQLRLFRCRYDTASSSTVALLVP